MKGTTVSINFDHTFARAGSLLVSTDNTSLAPAFRRSVCLIIKQYEGAFFEGVFLHQTVNNNRGNDEAQEVADFLFRDDYVDDLSEIKLPILNGSPQGIKNFSHPIWGRTPNNQLSLSMPISIIHPHIDAEGAQPYGEFAVSSGADACKSLRGRDNKTVILQETLFYAGDIQEQFGQSVWAHCIPATREIVLDTPPENRWEQANTMAKNLG